MADLDTELARRLSRLATAVPVSSAHLDPVHRHAVAARHRVRMAWVTPLAALVAVVVVGSLLDGGAQPGATAEPTSQGGAQPANHLVNSVVRSGDFELMIESAKAWYLPGEPIALRTTLTYVGPDRAISITHGHGSPMSYGIEEPVNGLALAPGWRLSCEGTQLTRDVPLEKPFAKVGAFSGDDPRASEFEAFFADRTLRLPEGTWHPYVLARFSLGGCVPTIDPGAEIEIRAEIEIEVVATPPPAATQPSPGQSAAVVSATDRWRSITLQGDFEFGLEASNATFATGTPLEVTASLRYRGPEERVVIGHALSGPIEFSMPGSGVNLIPAGPRSCADVDLARGAALPVQLVSLGKQGGPFGVTHGLYEITALASFRIGGCDAPQAVLGTSIIVAVVDGPDDIPLFTDRSGTGACLLLRNGGRLATSETGLGVVKSDGTAREVVWPPGYSARLSPEGALLIGEVGQVVAREGDQIVFDAWNNADGPLYPCGAVELDPSVIELRTAAEPTDACNMALGGGTLASHPESGFFACSGIEVKSR